MASRNKRNKNGNATVFGKKVLLEITGALFLAAMVFSFVSIVTFSQTDPSFNQYLTSDKNIEVKNFAGIIGAHVSDGLVQFSGSAAFLFPCFFFILGWGFIRGNYSGYFVRFSSIFLLLVVSTSALMALYFPDDPFFGMGVRPGGLCGFFVSSLLVKYLNKGGSYIVMGTLLCLSFLIATRWSLNRTIEAVKSAFLVVFGLLKAVFTAGKEVLVDLFSLSSETVDKMIAEKRAEWKEKAAEKARLKEEASLMVDDLNQEKPNMETKSAPRIVVGMLEPGPSKQATPGRKKKKELQEPFPFLSKMRKYKVPPVTLLDEPRPDEGGRKQNEADFITNARILEKKLEAFGVQGKVVQVLPGPVITMYEYEPGPGVKVSKIMNLTDDLALSMRAATVRILAPVPGKAVVGIEIPNLNRQTVCLRDVLSSGLYQDTKSRLTIAIGSDTMGQPVVADLAQVPHLLIAGSTGSGKSVGLNGMIVSILLKSGPDDVKFIMIDPKMLELSIYEGIPHLLTPVVTDPKKAASALKWAVVEMEKRYQLLSEQGVRNIQGYNKLVKEKKKAVDDSEEEPEELLFRSLGQKDEDLKDQFKDHGEDAPIEEEKKVEPPTEKLPYIVIIIDELADLMMTAPKEVEFSIARLAQMARAAGIHMIVATQRPSVDVLTGLIKANFPARIAYKVASRVDSRTILDSMGAEKLLGKGDLLFAPPGTSKLERIHGCWVSDIEVKRVVEFLKRQQKPTYIKNILKMTVKEEVKEEDEYADPMYDQAIALVISMRMASISMVQRKLRIGYNRAARMIEKMETDGIVGPSDGVKQREVFAREM